MNSIHPTAIIDPKAQLGENVSVGPYTTIGPHVVLGAGCVIHNHVTLTGCTTLGQHVHVEDGARISGLVAVHHFVRIGTASFIAGCAKLSIDVPPFTLAEGHPAEIKALNKEGLKRRGMSDEAMKALKEAYRLCIRGDMRQEQAIEEIARKGCD